MGTAGVRLPNQMDTGWKKELATRICFLKEKKGTGWWFLAREKDHGSLLVTFKVFSSEIAFCPNGMWQVFH